MEFDTTQTQFFSLSYRWVSVGCQRLEPLPRPVDPWRGDCLPLGLGLLPGDFVLGFDLGWLGVVVASGGGFQFLMSTPSAGPRGQRPSAPASGV